MNKKNQHIFDIKHLDNDLKRRSLRSGAVTLVSQGIMFLIQLGSTMILARILTPRDYGVMAMVVAVTGFASLLSNLGLSTATIQRAEINHGQVSTLFWINAGVGTLVTLVVAILSPFVAWFYKEPVLKGVMLVLSCNFLINSLSVQHNALLTRQMRFYSIAKIQIISTVAGIAVAILAAYKGFGYWALVLNSLVASLFSVVGTWIASGWVPGLFEATQDIRSLIKFGSDVMGFNIVNYFARNLDNILIGKYNGSSALGLYSKAYQLLMMPITNLRDPLTKVAMPALSSLQNQPEQYRNYYLKCVSLLAFVSMPIVVFMFVYSDHFITLLLGSKWLGACDIFRILAISALFQPVSGTVGMILITTGRSRLYLLMGFANAILISFSFVVGLPWGPIGVATSYTIANYLILLPNLVYAFRGTSINVGEFFVVVLKPLLSSIIMGASGFVLLNLLSNLNVVPVLIMSFIACALIYLVVFATICRGYQDIIEYITYGRLIVEKK